MAARLPVFKDWLLYLGPIVFTLFAAFVIVGASNSVNLTDGLDGLAIVPIMIAAACFAGIAYLVGNSFFADYLQIHYVEGVGELAILCSAMVGAGLGFLWFNAPRRRSSWATPVRSLAGRCSEQSPSSPATRSCSPSIGGLFVAEALSVMVQVFFYRTTKRRVFLMAPFHHHFEKKGWSEPTIVVRFWIIAVICALIGLSTLKLR